MTLRIEIQDLLFTVFDCERLIELGPSPTFMGMAARNLKAMSTQTMDVSAARTPCSSALRMLRKSTTNMRTDVRHLSQISRICRRRRTCRCGSCSCTIRFRRIYRGEDALVKAIDILLVFAQKFKERVDEILLSNSIEDLTGGKLTLQNEIMGGFQQEFTPSPRRATRFLSRNSDLLWEAASTALAKVQHRSHFTSRGRQDAR